ncbi:hypothetical protein H696_00917 [Fonticula alba]|uniref:Cap-specific mRNA (nucleoside-2'-O-)-methyltransferase 1 n=1 Tax=Fonticula alba TaxID=691883 RepID=A0A058ZHG2_FONAL|nr:hypothetical protein H696_00917 [Fonticula alba]KCV73378.1 hypothetical protein H696_00917 [Fonticula alba]|eukprot:XP_009493079.1 hypothetical protein H696_00917 [Fonticula alba]
MELDIPLADSAPLMAADQVSALGQQAIAPEPVPLSLSSTFTMPLAQALADGPLESLICTGTSYQTHQQVKDNNRVYCVDHAYDAINELKSSFDTVPDAVFTTARAVTNPFESLGSGPYRTRTPIKLLLMDAEFDLAPLLPSVHDTFYFAEIAPVAGLFAEYIFSKHNISAQGVCMNLSAQRAGRLPPRLSPELRENLHTFTNKIASASLMSTEVIRDFVNFTKRSFDGELCHFVIADGTVNTNQAPNQQEQLVRHLVFCEMLTGLSILRKGGSMALKVFDTVTPFSVGMIYILTRLFNSVHLVKPSCSRPAGSERYLVCRGFLQSEELVALETDDQRAGVLSSVLDKLFTISEELSKLRIHNLGLAERPENPITDPVLFDQIVDLVSPELLALPAALAPGKELHPLVSEIGASNNLHLDHQFRYLRLIRDLVDTCLDAEQGVYSVEGLTVDLVQPEHQEMCRTLLRQVGLGGTSILPAERLIGSGIHQLHGGEDRSRLLPKRRPAAGAPVPLASGEQEPKIFRDRGFSDFVQDSNNPLGARLNVPTLRTVPLGTLEHADTASLSPALRQRLGMVVEATGPAGAGLDNGDVFDQAAGRLSSFRDRGFSRVGEDDDEEEDNEPRAADRWGSGASRRGGRWGATGGHPRAGADPFESSARLRPEGRGRDRERERDRDRHRDDDDDAGAAWHREEGGGRHRLAHRLSTVAETRPPRRHRDDDYDDGGEYGRRRPHHRDSSHSSRGFGSRGGGGGGGGTGGGRRSGDSRRHTDSREMDDEFERYMGRG